MKNIFKLLFVLIAASAFLTSCDKETFSESSTNPVDLGLTTYYLQFVDAAQFEETAVSLAGDLVEIETTVAVALMGAPQSSDITVDFVIDPSTTIDPSMYTMSGNSITIPAGKTSGSVSFTTIAANMPVGDTLNFVLNMDAGEHNSPNAAGLKIDYLLKRIEFCPLTNGAADLVGGWSGTDGTFWSSQVTTVLNGDDLVVSGISVNMMEGWWGEPIVAGGSFTMTVAPNGEVDIPRQYIYTSTYGGAEYRYEVEGSGKWTNCGDKPTLLIIYDIYYEGDTDGLAKTYASYLDGTGYFTLDVVLGSKKNAEVLSNFPKMIR